VQHAASKQPENFEESSCPGEEAQRHFWNQFEQRKPHRELIRGIPEEGSSSDHEEQGDSVSGSEEEWAREQQKLEVD